MSRASSLSKTPPSFATLRHTRHTWRRSSGLAKGVAGACGGKGGIRAVGGLNLGPLTWVSAVPNLRHPEFSRFPQTAKMRVRVMSEPAGESSILHLIRADQATKRNRTDRWGLPPRPEHENRSRAPRRKKYFRNRVRKWPETDRPNIDNAASAANLKPAQKDGVNPEAFPWRI